MSKQLTLREVFQALLDGKKITRSCWPQKTYIYLKDDKIMEEDDDIEFEEYTFYDDGDYKLYEESKEKKVIIRCGINAFAGNIVQFSDSQNKFSDRVFHLTESDPPFPCLTLGKKDVEELIEYLREVIE